MKKLHIFMVGIICIIIIASIGPASENSNNLTSDDFVLQELPLFNNEELEGIIVKTYVNNNGIIYGVEVFGESHYGEEGKDILDTGVSVIAQNTITSIKLYTQDKLEEKLKMVMLSVFYQI